MNAAIMWFAILIAISATQLFVEIEGKASKETHRHHAHMWAAGWLNVAGIAWVTFGVCIALGGALIRVTGGAP